MNHELTIPPKAKSIDQVLIHLDEIIDQSIQQGNYLCLFGYVYRETTAEIKKAILNGRFEDAARMEKMDVIFANLYIESYYRYLKDEKILSCWKFAFDSSTKNIAAIQHILLGMNAHINVDLAIAASRVAGANKIIELKNDFLMVNQILAELTNSMQKDLGRISFFMKILDFFGFRNDEKIINFSIKKARDFSWLNALELSLLKNDSQNARISEIDLRAMEISRIIAHPPGNLLPFLLKLIAIFEMKDPGKIMKKLRC